MTTDNIDRVLVTSGPTRAYIDRIRYIANTSSGALGARIVETLVSRGVTVTHLYGMGSEQPKVQNHRLIESVEMVTVDDVIATLKAVCRRGDISVVVHAMAVLDYVPESCLDAKKPSGDEYWDIHLVRTPKVISIIREFLPSAYMIGFKLEIGVTEPELVNRADVLLHTYGLDMVVANDLDKVNDERHEALLIGSGKEILARAETKEEIAQKITDCIMKQLYND